MSALPERFAHVEPTHGMADLFHSLPRGADPRFRTVRRAISKTDGALEFSGPELGVDEQDALLAILSAVCDAPRADDDEADSLVEGLIGGGFDGETRAIHTSWDKIGAAMGIKERRAQVVAAQRAMTLLAKTDVRLVTKDRTSWFVRLVNWRQEGKDLIVVLNPAAAAVAAGAWAVVVPLEERKGMSDGARILHARLCAWIKPGHSQTAALDTLAGHVWRETKSPSAMRRRLKQVQGFLNELAEAGWGVKPVELADGRPGVKITRPGLPREALPVREDGEMKRRDAIVAAIVAAIIMAVAVAVAWHGGLGQFLRMFVQRWGGG